MKEEDIKTETITGRVSTTLINVASPSASNDAPRGSTIPTDSTSRVTLTTIDEQVGTDTQGWPTHQLRLISLLRTAGVTDDILVQIPQDILTTLLTVNDHKITDVTYKNKELCLIY